MYFAMHDCMIIFFATIRMDLLRTTTALIFQNLHPQILSHASKKLDFLVTPYSGYYLARIANRLFITLNIAKIQSSICFIQNSFSTDPLEYLQGPPGVQRPLAEKPGTTQTKLGPVRHNIPLKNYPIPKRRSYNAQGANH